MWHMPSGCVAVYKGSVPLSLTPKKGFLLVVLQIKKLRAPYRVFALYVLKDAFFFLFQNRYLCHRNDSKLNYK